MVALVAVTVGVLPEVAAHPYHTGELTAELNRETGRMEIGLRVAIEDLEAALTKRAGARMRVTEEATPDREIESYLRAHLRVFRGTDVECPFVWVGKELEQLSVWLYFEIEIDEIEGARFSTRLFHEVAPGYVLTATFVDGDRRRTMCFSQKVSSQQVSLESVRAPRRPRDAAG